MIHFLITSIAIYCCFYSCSLKSDYFEPYFNFETYPITANVLQCVNETSKPFIMDLSNNSVEKFETYVRVTEQLFIVDREFMNTFMKYISDINQLNTDVDLINLGNFSLTHPSRIRGNKVTQNDIIYFYDLLMQDENILLLNKFTVLLQGLHQYGYYLIKNNLPLELLQYNFDQIMNGAFPFEFSFELNFTQSYTAEFINLRDEKYVKYYDVFFHPTFAFTPKCQSYPFVLNYFQSNWITRLENLRDNFLRFSR